MKKFILSLFVLFVGIISFCSSAYDVYPMYSIYLQNPTSTSINWEGVSNSDRYCIVNNYGTLSYDFSCSNNWINLPYHNSYCVSKSEYPQGQNICFNGNGEIGIVYYADSELTLPYTSLQCQTEYNLIPISEIDTNYCVGNGLCPNECGSGSDMSGDLQYSNIYINSILHPGRQNIFVDIPDYITWDYSSTGDDFNLYVGSGYDVDYINSIIDINSYRPDSKDFTDVFVGGLTLITPYIVAILFFYLIWRLLKRIFS